MSFVAVKTPRWFMLGALLFIQTLDLTTFSLAQYEIAFDFAETWGCRFWTIQLSMVTLCGFSLIWTVVLFSVYKEQVPGPCLARCFLGSGAFMHAVPAITTIMDYSNSFHQPGSISKFCNYSAITLVVAVLELISGLLHLVLMFIIK